MLKSEAEWIGDALIELPHSAFPLLNLGSSTGEFRQVKYPWIHDRIFARLADDGRHVVHADLKVAPGVDVVGDFLTGSGRRALEGVGARSVLCSNLLEHLPIRPAAAADAIAHLVPAGGWLVITCPRQYGYHADPIDNGYRPRPEEVAALFPGFEVVSVQEVLCRRMAYYFADAGRSRLRFALRLCAPFIRPANWWRLVRESWTRTSASCAVLRRPDRSPGA